jgi:ATP-dependent Clp protease ATP-binding subunit ClpC
MFERFTDRARRVIVLAQEEARLLDHNYIGTEHLLLGLIREEDDVAAKVLGDLGVSLDAVRDRVVSMIARGNQPPRGHIPFTPPSKKVLELSLRESVALGHDYIGTEHLLLGLVSDGDGVAGQVLTGFGLAPNRVRQAVIQRLWRQAAPHSPDPEVAPVLDELASARAEIARLTALLREHGIDPGGEPSDAAEG